MNTGKKHVLKKFNRRRAASVVEMAVISPLLITIVFGIIEFGWAFMVRQLSANAVREGVRVAAIQTAVDDTEIRQAVKDAMDSITMLTLLDSDIDITHWCFEADGTPNFSETVTVTIPYENISLLGDYFSWINFDDITISSSMRKEGVTEDSTAPGSGICS